MESIRLGVPLLAAALICGCYAPPQRVDPLAGLARSAAATQRLSVVLVDTDNARNARKYLTGIKYAGPLTDVLFENITNIFRRNFKSVTKADSLDQARASSPDVIAMVDVYARVFQGFMNAGNHLELGVVLLARDGTEIDQIKAARDANGLTNPAPTGPMTELATQTPLALEQALLASRKLRDFAASAPAPASVKPAVAAAPLIDSDIDTPSYSLPGDERKFALVVGVENYASLPAAEFAERDAEAVRRHLVALGYPERQIVLLRGEKATLSGIKKYVEKWLPSQAQDDSQVLFYFSGHGAPDPSSGQAYLVPWDGDPKYLSTTGYSLGRLYKDLAALKAARVLVALDSCFSGAGGRSVLAKGVRPLVTKLDEGQSGLGKVVVLAASGPDEITGVDPEQGHGDFTYRLLKALDYSGGKGSVRSIFERAKVQVEDDAHRDSREQTPRLIVGQGQAPSTNLAF